MASPKVAEHANRKSPVVKSLQDLTIIEAWDSKTGKTKYITFYLITPDEELYFGQSSKDKKDMSLAEFTLALERVGDEEIYPEIPTNVTLTPAPDAMDDTSVFIKRPGLNCYEDMKGTNYVFKSVLDETLIMKQISQSPHPNIIGYHGCRLRRGRITSIVLERLDETITQYARTPAFQCIDKTRCVEALESSLNYLHSLGLAHNDINPDNIMVRDGMPVLIDFGSCQPFGNQLQSLGTPGWYEEQFFTSEKKHDTYSLIKFREWIQNPK